jgi:PBSX family phage terminase large subunit
MIRPLVGKQRRSVQLATARINLWEGSVRSSKTVSSLLWWLCFVRTGPAGNLAMIGKTERTLKRNVIDPLIDMLGPQRCKPNWGEGEMLLLGRRIYLAGANNELAVGKIQGLTLAGAYVDEVSLLPEAFWAMLLTRLSVEGAQLGGTTNPDNPNHWLMRDYLKKASTWLRHDGTIEESTETDRLDLARFSFRLADNPALPPAYVAALAAEFTGLWRLRYIEGLWVLADGAIYDAFDPTPGRGVVVTTLPEIEQWIVAVDYGTTNPFVALLIGLGRDDRMYVAAEWRHDSKAKRRQMTDSEYSAALRRWLDDLDIEGARTPERVYVDPSAASFIAQLWRDQWAGVHGADNAVADGIRATASLLGKRLMVHESCTGLVGEMTGYVWDSAAAERGKEQPLKVDDHGPDALRYGVMGTRRWWRHWLTMDLSEAA